MVMRVLNHELGCSHPNEHQLQSLGERAVKSALMFSPFRIATAEEIIQLRADALRKRDPSLTPEQAFSKVYCAPENMHLRRAEREAHTDDPVEKATVPLASAEPRVLQSLAMDEVNSIAEQSRFGAMRNYLRRRRAPARIFEARKGCQSCCFRG
jgi:hypothetical protein